MGILDADAEVAFATVVLGLLRPGYRSVPLRSKHGTHIRLCSLLVHIELADDEPSPIARHRDLMDTIRRQQLKITEQKQIIRDQQERIQALEERERAICDRERLEALGTSSGSTIELDASQVRLRPATVTMAARTDTPPSM